ncbi:hypothetical protein DERF_013381 [Dermatophagoides farinae]|uniref:Uncharacterized protein n=1 Tax=Dermatophagoides farinae TaxID=6954 RepID=A0A922KV40_DERFA|nr:hypothetical protein DERF_013381 [Dermatophagoides farinae]
MTLKFPLIKNCINLAFDAGKPSWTFLIIFSTNITIYSSSSEVEVASKETHSVLQHTLLQLLHPIDGASKHNNNNRKC